MSRYGKPCSHGKPPGTCTECRAEAAPAPKGPPPIPVAPDRAQLGAQISGSIAGAIARPGANGPGGDPHAVAEWSSNVAEAILRRWGL